MFLSCFTCLEPVSVKSTAKYIIIKIIAIDSLCGLVVRVPGYRSRGPGFDSRRYQIFWEVVRQERGPLSFVSITEELLEWQSSGSGSRKPRLTAVGIFFLLWEKIVNIKKRPRQCPSYPRGDLLHWPHDTLYRQKLSLTSPTIGDRSVGIVRLRTKATEFSFLF
jgi:hypothetical protein